MATLSAVVARLDAMNEVAVDEILRKELAKAARPFAPAVRAAILNIPTHGEKHTGLRLRIARCVTTWATIDGPVVSVGIAIDSDRMPSGQFSLPLMMEGVKRFRHPVFGDRSNWVAQESHPYFYSATALFGPASRNAIQRAVNRIAATIDAP